MKWEVPNRAEEKICREHGIDPDACAVCRVGTDYLVLKELKSGREVPVKVG